MRREIVIIIPLLAAMVSLLAFVGLNSVNAQNMNTPDTNMAAGSNMTNATMGGNEIQCKKCDSSGYTPRA